MSLGLRVQESIEDATLIPKSLTTPVLSWLYFQKGFFLEGITRSPSSLFSLLNLLAPFSSQKILTLDTNLSHNSFHLMIKMTFRHSLKISTLCNPADRLQVQFKENKFPILNVVAAKAMEWLKSQWDAIKTLFSPGTKFMSRESLTILQEPQKLPTAKSVSKISDGKYPQEVQPDCTPYQIIHCSCFQNQFYQDKKSSFRSAH